ncbi:MAG: RNase H [Lachnospiraceae bacterium]|nr:RNase H [Lachnospiraceae bacterium]MCI9388227.1 RNase H [Lachnospiraceae bacterium]MCI9469798.1 RNase H [Lachnospiraceae bacterium]
MAKKVYAVRTGRKPGIYQTWAQCQEQVRGFSGAVFKSFPTMAQAEEYMRLPGSAGPGASEGTDEIQTEAVAYVDGSYQAGRKQFSCGVVLFHEGEELHFSELYDDAELAQMRNVAGEIKGSQKAIQYCLDHQIKSVTIFHDYEGIAKWCTGEWQTKKEGTQSYKAFYEQAKGKVDIRFVKVKGHSGDTYNDLADQLAKKAFL